MLFRLLTLLAIAALAIVSWISSSPGRRTPAAAGGSPDMPGYYLEGAVLTDFDATGRPSIRLEAARIDQVDHGSDVRLSAVRVDYQAPSGQSWVLVGDTGSIGGGRIVDVAGHVQLTGDAAAQATPTVIDSDAMRYDVALAEVSTRDDVRIRIGEQATFTAGGLEANLRDRTLHLDTKVHGRFVP